MTKTLGADVSSWNGEILWETMKSHLEFVFIRLSGGYTKDKKFDYNWNESKKVGLPRGLYWYIVNARTIKNQFEDMKKWLGSLDDGEFPITLDYEDPEKNMPKEQRIARLEEFCMLVKQWKKQSPIIYTGPSYWTRYGNRKPEWETYPLWIAHYTFKPEPIVPKPWDKYTFWQYTNKGKGSVYGTQSKQIDLNIYPGTFEQLKMHFSISGSQPVPPAPELPMGTGIGVICNCSTLNVRSGPGLTYSIVGHQHTGDEVKILEENNGWYKIDIDKWVYSKYVCIKR